MSWHERLGHPGTAALRRAIKDKSIVDLPHQLLTSKIAKCKVCQESKQKKKPKGKKSLRDVSQGNTIFADASPQHPHAQDGHSEKNAQKSKCKRTNIVQRNFSKEKRTTPYQGQAQQHQSGFWGQLFGLACHDPSMTQMRPDHDPKAVISKQPFIQDPFSCKKCARKS